MEKKNVSKKKNKKDPAQDKLRLSDGLIVGDGALLLDIFQNFPDIIHSVNSEGRIVFTNKKATELLGYSHEELIGKLVYECYADEIQDLVKAGFAELKKTGFKERVESWLKTKDGTIIPVEIRSLSLYDKDRKFVKTFSIIRDMREMNKLRSQIVQQGKLAAIGELASGIMHDIRNPLAIVSSYNNLFHRFLEAIPQQALVKRDDALRGASKQIKKQDLIKGDDHNSMGWFLTQKDFYQLQNCQKAIAKAEQRIERLTRHLQRFVHEEDEKVEDFLLSSVLEDALLMSETKLRDSGAELSNQIKGLDAMLRARPHQLEQVLINVLINAADAVAKSAKKLISISLTEETNKATISITDTGSGIKKEDLPYIFDTFFTTKPQGEGTGLGLSICQRIIKQEGGEIEISSKENVGTQVRIILPCL
ncbi:MAG: PAS domain S-box protein [Oligoflexales bacterium]|nr:PAS domain S-box protein [Oligoflexales bacterium]